MEKITSSGLHSDEFGQLALVTQGLGGYTLVARKKILFRLFLDVPMINPTAVLATIRIKIGGLTITKNILIPSGSLLIETTGPYGPSVGVVFTGDMFPFPGTYKVSFSVRGTSSFTPQFKLNELVFLPPGRVRLLIHNLVGKAPWGTNIQPNFGWLVEMFQALERFSAMLPVRDGIKFGLAQQNAGICFLFGENIDPWNCPSGLCTQPEKIDKLLRETKIINSAGTSEHVDATMGWRPRDTTMFPPPGGENAGGKAFPSVALASFVGGNESGREKTASVMAQEVGHIFGLEPAASPYSDGGGHSRNRAVIDPFAFDFLLLKPYRPVGGDFIGDVMGVGWHQGKDMVLFNAFDWEHLRKRLVQLPSLSGLAEKKRPAKNQQAEVVDELNEIFAKVPEMKVADPGKALPSRKGVRWHWTDLGFEPVNSGENNKARARLSPSAEAILTWLEDLGVPEVYAPIDGRSLHLVINPNTATSLPERDFGVSGHTADEAPDRVSLGDYLRLFMPEGSGPPSETTDAARSAGARTRARLAL